MSYPIRLPVNQPLVTVTHPTPTIWVIELHNGADSRLTTTLIDGGLKPALDAVERDWRNSWRAAQASKDKNGGKGALILVGNRSQDKFFSNGLDFENLIKDPNYTTNFFPLVYNPLMQRLLTFPIPTVAAINGHCFAGGMMLTLCCDYRVMTDGSKRNSWMCMNEVHFGASMPLSFTALIRAKVANAQVHRKVALEGHKFTPSEALEVGLVDHLASGNTEAILAKAQAVGEQVGEISKSGAWSLIRRGLYRDVLETSARDVIIGSVAADDAAAKARL